MNTNQEYTPKYWVAHWVSSDDIILETASKSREECEIKLGEIALKKGEGILGKYISDLDSGLLEISLMEIKLVNC